VRSGARGVRPPDLGHPFSQIVGIQAVLNIVTGDRYSMAPDETVIYLMNAFGVPPAPVDRTCATRC
jgi:oxaloacetate decarboxylase (Na+ extruding) subunit alpha